MVARSLLARRLRYAAAIPRVRHVRSIASGSSPSSKQNSTPVDSHSTQNPTSHPRSWLTQKVEESPAAMGVFLKLAKLLGYGSPKQVAGRRAFTMYEQLCIVRPDEEMAFWQQECHLPPTFQSWFTIVNLHVWLLTVRLRAVPQPHGMHHLQGLIDHFFLDVEDRIRAVLQPVTPDSFTPVSSRGPYTAPSSFYTVANMSPDKKRPRGRAPERLVSQQMKIFKEQWAGTGMSFDASLIRGDADMAAVIWRNLLGGRGARGIVYPYSVALGEQKPHFRRSVNLVGGEVVKVKDIEKRGLEAEEARDDGSGVHDYAPSEADKYVAYPELMATITSYLRRELVRLQNIPDEKIIGPGVAGREGEGVLDLKFRQIR